MSLTKWKDRIETAREIGEFTDTDRNDAEDWAFCAVGQTFNVDPKRSNHELLGAVYEDRKMHELGLAFSESVCNNWVDMAEVILSQIEKRASKANPSYMQSVSQR